MEPRVSEPRLQVVFLARVCRSVWGEGCECCDKSRRDPGVRRGLHCRSLSPLPFLSSGCESPAKFTKASWSSPDRSAALRPAVPILTGSPPNTGRWRRTSGEAREVAAAAWRGSRGPTSPLQELCYFATFYWTGFSSLKGSLEIKSMIGNIKLLRPSRKQKRRWKWTHMHSATGGKGAQMLSGP